MNQPKAVRWLGDSLKQVRSFPLEVKQDIGVSLFDVQQGTTPENAKPFKGVGRGVFEIVTRFDTNTYRTVYAVQIGDKVYVLHAFQKKSPKGIKTAQTDVNLIKQRYRQAFEMEKEVNS
ncbi:MAG: type II toxin-antitoxin system RelE/ParE family toxin [Acaryochloridaceae cyanobacterium RL_2_7]|nr:type II toxin-antitoxin system RelE/ParE family toxin [Acaryochloridaceae cyanobacterium RL_2_7]